MTKILKRKVICLENEFNKKESIRIKKKKINLKSDSFSNVSTVMLSRFLK